MDQRVSCHTTQGRFGVLRCRVRHLVRKLVLNLAQSGPEDIAKVLLAAETITLTTHQNPDGDGVGSGLALMIALEQLGKTVRFCCPTKVASLWNFMPQFERIEVVEEDAAARALPPCDVLLSVDCGDLKRLGAVAHAPHTTMVNVDHHSSNDLFGQLNLVRTTDACTGIGAADIIRACGVVLNESMAACLYAAVSFDTGRFMHSNTDARTLAWTAELLETGLDASAINRAMTYVLTPHDLQVQKLGIEKLQLVGDDCQVAGIALSAEDIAAVGAPEDWGIWLKSPAVYAVMKSRF